MKKLTLLLVLFASLGICQSPSWNQTVYTQVFDDLAVSPSVSANLPGIGQTVHSLIIHASDNAPNVCSILAVDIDVVLEVSFDNIVWFDNVTQHITNPYIDGYGQIVANGSSGGTYPYIRVGVVSFDNINCTLDIFYGGSVSPSSVVNTRLGTTSSPYVTDLGLVTMPISEDNASYPLATAIYVTERGSLEPLEICSASIPINVGAVATTQVVALSAGQVIHVCSLDISLAAAGTFQVVSGTGANCGTGTVAVTGAFTLAQGIPLSIGGNLGFTLTSGVASQALCLTTTGAGATAQGLLSYSKY